MFEPTKPSRKRKAMNAPVGIFSVSSETVRQAAKHINQRQVMAARYGQQVADAHLKPRSKGVRTTRALERVEVDNFFADVHLLCARTGEDLGRPWMTFLVDHYSGIVLGWYIHFSTPSASAILAALKDAILPSDGHLGFGIPDLLVMDNGKDYASAAVQDACMSLGIKLLFAPPGTPWYKGHIERFGRTLNTKVIHWIRGTTLGQPTGKMNYNAAENATMTDESFREIVDDYVRTQHNKFRRKNQGSTAERMFVNSIKDWPVRVPISVDALDLALSLSYTRALRQTGLHLSGIQYQSDELALLWPSTSDRLILQIKVNPTNLQHIRVLHPLTKTYFTAYAQEDFDWPRSLDYHLTVRAYARLKEYDPDDQRALARAELELKAKLVAATGAEAKKAFNRLKKQVAAEAKMQEVLDAHDADDAKRQGAPSLGNVSVEHNEPADQQPSATTENASSPATSVPADGYASYVPTPQRNAIDAAFDFEL